MVCVLVRRPTRNSAAVLRGISMRALVPRRRPQCVQRGLVGRATAPGALLHVVAALQVRSGAVARAAQAGSYVDCDVFCK